MSTMKSESRSMLKQNDCMDKPKEMLASAAETAAANARQAGNYFVAEPASDLFSTLSDYAKRKPDVAAMWCFGLGLLVGWRLRG